MKKVVLITVMLFLAVTSSINLQANVLPVEKNSEDVVSFTEPIWYTCSKYGRQRASREAEFDSPEWYRLRNRYSRECREIMK